MKNFIFIFSGILLLLFSCKDDPDLFKNAPDPGESILLPSVIKNFIQYKPVESPVLNRSRYNGNEVTRTIIFHPSSGTFAVVSNFSYCSTFNPPLQMVVEGGGTATLLGRYDVRNLACVDPSGNFLSPVYGFITAANGDEIHTQMGEPFPDLDNPPNFYFPYIIIGGTGRFINASGYVNMYGIADYVALKWNLSGEGEITY